MILYCRQVFIQLPNIILFLILFFIFKKKMHNIRAKSILYKPTIFCSMEVKLVYKMDGER